MTNARCPYQILWFRARDRATRFLAAAAEACERFTGDRAAGMSVEARRRRKREPGFGPAQRSSPVVANGRVYLGSQDGGLYP
jgi:PQQ-like domain